MGKKGKKYTYVVFIIFNFSIDSEAYLIKQKSKFVTQLIRTDVLWLIVSNSAKHAAEGNVYLTGTVSTWHGQFLPGRVSFYLADSFYLAGTVSTLQTVSTWQGQFLPCTQFLPWQGQFLPC